jgi:radical SAM superfamily enzyme
MAAAGCTAISFGVQSGSPAILNAIRRDPRETAELAKTIRLCRRHNILTIVTYIFGLPGETPQTIEESVRSCLRLDSHLADFHPLFVLPGSAIDRECGDQPVCQATAEEIQRACAAAFRRFYLRPATLARLFWLVLRKNPAYLARILHPVKLLARKLLAGNG